MPPEFPLIYQYQDMLKHCGNGDYGESMTMLKEADQPKTLVEEEDMKVNVKLEEPSEPDDFYTSITDMFTNNSTNHSNNYNTSSCNNYRNIANTNTNMSQESIDSKDCILPFRNYSGHFENSARTNISTSTCKTSAETTAAQASFFATHLSFPSLQTSSYSSSSSSTMSSSLPSTLSTSYSSMAPTTKASTCVKELAGSGCTMVSLSPSSTPTFGANTSFVEPSFEDYFQGESPEYTDLDKAKLVPLPCAEFDALGVDPLMNAQSDVPLEEALTMMKIGVQRDCDNLELPYNPVQWTPQQVARWVRWVCQKEKHPDISGHFLSMDGSSLCACSAHFLSQYGVSGVCVSNELEFVKAATSYLPGDSFNTGFEQLKNSPSNEFRSSPQFINNGNSVNITPCSSPGSSTSQDSNSSHVLFNSDPTSEEDSCYRSSQSTSPCPSSKSGSDQRIATRVPGRGHKQTIHLWQFLRELLLSRENNSDCIRWIDRSTGIFKIEDSKKVANMWGARKNRPAMNYDKLSRSVRQYYKKGIIKKTQQSKRLVYQFCQGYL